MSQTPREIVKAALRFEGPERLPVRMACFGCDDTRWIPWRTRDEWTDGRKHDEWGCHWEQTELANMGQPKGHPLSGVEEHDKLVAPDYSEDWRYEGAEEAIADAEAHGLYAQTGIFMVLFERMHSLAGFENVLVALLTDRENAGALADKIVESHLSLVRGFQERFGSRLDSFSMTDDWGTQQAAFVSMDLWYDFFFPRYKRIFDAMHEGGQDVWVHSCGKVNEIIQGYIDAGVDAVNLQQPRALGIEEIGCRYRGKITFESLSDIQASLPSGDPERIRADARALAEHWMSPDGGFVLSDYGDGVAIGADPEAKMVMYRAFSEASAQVYGRPLPEPVPQPA
jgi:uroporphyrinogen-III decarboxylase